MVRQEGKWCSLLLSLNLENLLPEQQATINLRRQRSRTESPLKRGSGAAAAKA